MKKYNSFNSVVSALEDGKKVNGKHYPLFIIREMQDIKDLKSGKTYDTITEDTKELCLTCGLQVRSKGIGWQITKRLDKLLGTVYG
jgi:hypothetical protein